MKKLSLSIFIVLIASYPARADFVDVPDDTTVAPPPAEAVAPAPAVASPTARPDLGRHHIHLGVLGLFRSFNSSLNFPEMDARWASAADMCYRYSLTPRWDLAVDLHGWGYVKQKAPNGEFTLDGVASGLGLGCRYNIPLRSRRLYPYVQANAYRVAVGMETMSDWSRYIWKREGSGWGGGLNAGVELRLARWISIPIEVYCLAANPTVTYTGAEISVDQYGNPWYNPIRRNEGFDITGIGWTAGLSVNLGSFGPATEPRAAALPPLGATPVPPAPELHQTIGPAAEESTSAQTVPAPQAMPIVETTAAIKKVPRHHLSAGLLGYAKVDDADFGQYGTGATKATCNTAGYRYTLGRVLDLTAEALRWSNNFEHYPGGIGQVRYIVSATALGMGLRATLPEPGWPVRPYLQVSAVGITESIEVETGGQYSRREAHDYGALFGSGAEVRVAGQVGIPVHLFYLLGKPADNVGAMGVTAGMALSW